MKRALKDIPAGSKIRLLGLEGEWLGVTGEWGRVLLPITSKGKKARGKQQMKQYEIHQKKLGTEVDVIELNTTTPEKHDD